MVRNDYRTARRAVHTSVFAAVAMSASAALASHNSPPDAPYGTGTIDKGAFEIELYRGVAVPFELSLIATPNDCQGHVDLKVKWDAEQDQVHVKMRSAPNTLEQFPDIDRTLGVDYLPNQFFPELEDVVDGRYQLWLISAAGPVMNFWYSPETLDLVGGPGEFDPDGPPPAGLIPVPFPTLYMFATPMFQPKANGSVKVDWSFPYSGAHRGDRPEYSHHIVTFPPPNLCFANPFRLDLSHLRPYISDPLPIENARPWSDYLRGGLLFDITVEPPEYFVEPPLTNLSATYSGATAVGGSVPQTWQLDIESAFAGLAPPIKRFPGADSCEQYFEGFHAPGINFCPPPGP
jgi:hypothetical protein